MSKIMSPVLHGAKEEALVQGSEQRYLPGLPAFAPRPCHGEKQPGRPPQGAQGAGCAGRPRSVGTPTWRPGGSAAVPSAGAQAPNLAPSAPGGEGEGALTCDHRATRGLCAGRGSGTPRPSLGPRKHVRRGNGRRPDPARHTRRCDLAHSASHSQVWPGPIFSQVRLFLPQQTNTQRKAASAFMSLQERHRAPTSQRALGRQVRVSFIVTCETAVGRLQSREERQRAQGTKPSDSATRGPALGKRSPPAPAPRPLLPDRRRRGDTETVRGAEGTLRL